MNTADANRAWQRATARYQDPSASRSAWQLANSVVPYLGVCYLMYRSLAVSYWLALALSVLAAGFIIRIFIIFHDCGHGAFFRSRRANDIVGVVTGVLLLTPYHHWRQQHAVHHATAGDLDRRTVGGEIWTMTVDEYVKSSPATRLMYRLYRNPLVMFGVGPFFVFLVQHRFASGCGTRSTAGWWDSGT